MHALFCSHTQEKTGAQALAATKEVLCANTFINVTKMMQKSSPRSLNLASARKSVILHPCVNNLFECLSCSWLVITPRNLCPNICFAHTHTAICLNTHSRSYQCLELINDLTALTQHHNAANVCVCLSVWYGKYGPHNFIIQSRDSLLALSLEEQISSCGFQGLG